MAHPRVTRVAGTKPGMRSTGESFESRCSEASFPRSGNYLIRPVRTAASRSLAPGLFEAMHTKLGIDSVELTLIGLLRHSKRFFGCFAARSGTFLYQYERTFTAIARTMP